MQADSDVHIHWKGAAEIVLACCTGYIDANDTWWGWMKRRFDKLVEYG